MTKENQKHKYKFKQLKVFTDKEYLFQTRKYRSVYMENEIDYSRAELQIFNILFDEEEWSGKAKFVCVEMKSGTEGKEICALEDDFVAKKTDNIIKVSKSWGTKDKKFWNHGKYRWKAFIDGNLLSTSDFWVEKGGEVTENQNPYFSITNIKFFESGDKLPAVSDRVYLTEFKVDDTRYINAEINLNNSLDRVWMCELEFMFFTESYQKKAYFQEIKEFRGNSLLISTGWGNMSKTSWQKGRYTLEILFMGKTIAVIPFMVGENNVQGTPDMISGRGGNAVLEPELQEERLEDLLLDLDKLIGLNSIKKEVREYIDYLKFEEIRKEKGLKHNTKIKLHSVFTGNPGTGKTTVAKKLGAIFKAMGLLTGGHVHEVDRSDLVGEFIGQTAPKVKEAIEKARGGVLFIDEAYSLARENESSKDFGKEVIEILLKEMSDGPGNLAIFVAGYPKEMNVFINSNPGLKSRFSNYYHFQDYLPDELMQIAKSNIEHRGLFIEEDAASFLERKVTRAYRDRDDSFGNARFVLSLVDGAKMNMALRLVKHQDPQNLNDEELSTIKLDDVHNLFVTGDSKQLKLTIDEPRLKDALSELETLVGMNNIKQEIRDMVKLVRYYNDIGKDVMNKFVMHTVFKGNPGTGKTTVARIFAKIFNALGILEQGHLVECDRSDLIAEYTGQTAGKTLAKIEEAIGGVLFIDEAYALVDGASDNFGKEAISTILKQMEDRNKDFIIIAVGYPNNMDKFLESNPGLKSRFDQTMIFEDYTDQELFDIAELMFFNEELSVHVAAADVIKERLSTMYQNRDEYFGNAREVRKLVQDITQRHHLRMADLSPDQRTVKAITTITLEDLENLPDLEKSSRKRIGFGQS